MMTKIENLRPGERFRNEFASFSGRLVKINAGSATVEIDVAPRTFVGRGSNGEERRVEIGRSKKEITISRSTEVERVEKKARS